MRSAAQLDISPDSENTHIGPFINQGFLPTTDNDTTLAALLQHTEYNFSKLGVQNIPQQIRSKQMVDKLSQICSARIGSTATCRGRGADSGGERTNKHEGCRP